MEQMYSTGATFTPDNLIYGNETDILTKGVTLLKNQGVLARGTVIGIVTASKLAKPVDSTKSDGTEAPYGILTDDVDTDGATDVKTTAYITGIFNKEALVFGGADTADNHETELRKLGIYFK